MGPRRQRQLRDRHRHDADDDAHLRDRRHGRQSGCGSPTTPAPRPRPPHAVSVDAARRRLLLAAAVLEHRRPASTTGAWASSRAPRSPTATARARRPLTGGGPRSASPARVRRRHRHRRCASTAPPARASGHVNLSATSKLTLEFWLKWNAYANDDDLALEFTPNFNGNAGGFLVDPNAPEHGGKFAVGIGSGDSRNNVYFARPSAGAWHHYALRARHDRAGREQIIPYVDGQPVALPRPTAAPAPATSPTRASTSCRAPPARCSAPATSTRSRSTTARCARRRSPSTSAATPAVARRPLHRDAEPGPDRPDRSPSTARLQRPRRHDRQIRVGPRRQRQLRDQHRHDGDHDHTYATAGTVNVGLRVTDNGGITGDDHAAGHRRTAGGQRPTASRGRSPPPGLIDYWRLGETTRHDPRRQPRAQPGDRSAAAPTLGAPAALRRRHRHRGQLRRHQRRRQRRRSTSPAPAS